jgi:hypothetical protein
MSFYKYDEPPPKNRVRDHKNWGLYFQPTYNREDVKSFASEKVVWLTLLVLSVALVILLVPMALHTRSHPTDVPLPDPYDTPATLDPCAEGLCGE